LKPLPQDIDQTEPNARALDDEPGLEGIVARLERYERGGRSGPGDFDEPLTPELALVDPELARRARERLPEPQEQQRGARPRVVARSESGPTPATILVEPPRRQGGAARRPRRRRARRLLLVLVLVAAAAAAIVRVEPLKRFFWQSRQAAVTPTTGPPATVSPPRTPSAPSTAGAAPTTPQATKRRRDSATPPRHATPPSASTRTFVWPPVAKASYYLVSFYRGGRKIFQARPSSARLVLPARWTFKGRRYSLVPGRYAWRVRPGYGRGGRVRYGPAIVRAKLVIQRGSVG
jgi:hypothetical protein